MKVGSKMQRDCQDINSRIYDRVQPFNAWYVAKEMTVWEGCMNLDKAMEQMRRDLDLEGAQ